MLKCWCPKKPYDNVLNGAGAYSIPLHVSYEEKEEKKRA